VDVHPINDVVDLQLANAQNVDDATADRIGQNSEGIDLHDCAYAYTCISCVSTPIFRPSASASASASTRTPDQLLPFSSSSSLKYAKIRTRFTICSRWIGLRSMNCNPMPGLMLS